MSLMNMAIKFLDKMLAKVNRAISKKMLIVIKLDIY